MLKKRKMSIASKIKRKKIFRNNKIFIVPHLAHDLCSFVKVTVCITHLGNMRIKKNKEFPQLLTSPISYNKS